MRICAVPSLMLLGCLWWLKSLLPIALYFFFRTWVVYWLVCLWWVEWQSLLPIAVYCFHQDMGGLLIGLSMMGKMAISASYGIIYIFSAELYPTTVRLLNNNYGNNIMVVLMWYIYISIFFRNVGLGMSSMAARCLLTDKQYFFTYHNFLYIAHYFC